MCKRSGTDESDRYGKRGGRERIKEKEETQFTPHASDEETKCINSFSNLNSLIYTMDGD